MARNKPPEQDQAESGDPPAGGWLGQAGEAEMGKGVTRSYLCYILEFKASQEVTLHNCLKDSVCFSQVCRCSSADYSERNSVMAALEQLTCALAFRSSLDFRCPKVLRTCSR